MKKIIILCLLLPTIALYSKDLIIRNIKMKTLVNSLNCRPAAWALALCVLLISAFALRAEETVNYTLETVWEKQEYPPIIVTAAKFHPSGEFIYCAIGNEIRKMDAKTGEYVSVFDKTGISALTNIDAMEISNDGKYIITNNGVKRLFVWDVAAEKFLKEVKTENQPDSLSINSISFLGSSNILVFGLNTHKSYPEFTNSTEVIVFDWTINKELYRFVCPGQISDVKGSPDGKFIATGASWCDVPVKKWHDQLTLWSGADGKHVKTLQDDPSINTWNGYRLIKFSKDNKYIGCIENSYIGPLVHSLSNFQKFYLVNGKECADFEIIPNTDIIISKLFYLDSSTLEIRDINSNKVIGNYDYKATILESVLTADNKVFLYCFSGISTRICELKKSIGVGTNRNDTSIPYIRIIEGKMYLSIGINNYKRILLIIYDLNGKTIYKEEITSNRNEFEKINTILYNGIYLCKIIADGKEYTQKIEVAR
ncbi:MAG: T9SS type A sorting domain-containing protein [Chloroflexota bacterium]